MRLEVRFIAACVVATLLLGGCLQKPPLGGAADLSVVSTAELPAPGRADLSESGRNSYVSPFDKIVIDVFGISELQQREIHVDAAGRIAFPLIGTLQVAGLTPDQVSEVIRAGLMGSGVRNPQVTVNIADAAGQLVTVEGQVQEPGLYPVMNKMTLLRAIASAKGTTQFSDLDDVVLFRQVDNQRYAALYNLSAIRRGVYEDPAIYANDIIVVGDSPSRRLFRDVLAITPLLTTPLVVALNNSRN